jgi:pepF/M3 family oligoendopeptidase
MSLLPTWDLNPIYPGCESEEFLSDLKHMTEDAVALETHLGDERCDVGECISRYERILDYYENLQAYSSACLTTDTGNSVFLKAVGQVEQASLTIQHLEVAFLNFLASRKDEVLRLTQDGQALRSYRFVLTELLEEQSHLLDPDLEALASDLARSGCDAFSRLQEAMGSSIGSVWDEQTTKTVVQLRNEATNADRAIRKKAFAQEIALFRQYEIPFAAALNGVKGTTLTLDKKRGYASPLERSLSQSRIDRPVLDALIFTLEANLGLFRRYLKAKATLLGLPGCAFFDLFAPLEATQSSFSYAEAQTFIIEQFTRFSPDMGAFASQAFSNRWIDPESRKGKVGGAYDTAFPIAKQSRILSNFDDTFNGVSTLAHELGHAWHDHIVMDKSHLMRTYPMTLAETASIFSEFLVFQGALQQSDVKQRLGLVEHFLQDACQVCVDILSRFYFESAVFEQRAEGELTAAQFCTLMEDAQKRTYGDGLVEYHPYMWAAKGHYYSQGFSFYNYPYAFGQLFALGLYEKSTEVGPGFDKQYEALLGAAGSLPAREVALQAGIDLADPAFWQHAMSIIETYVKELEDALSH